MSKPILIASYYRSGTSALSGALSLSGVDMMNSAERNEHNPRGFFENPALAKMDLEFFWALGHQWHDIRLMPGRWHERPDVAAFTQRVFEEVKKHHADSPLWAVKHPHLCRLLPVYAEVVERLAGSRPGVIHIYRDPWVVARSQARKNGLSRSHALLLWASYVLDAERDARSYQRVVLDYETLLKEPVASMDRIGETLGIEFPNWSVKDRTEITRFLTPQLRRSKPQQKESTPTFVRAFIDDLWNAAISSAPHDEFDALRDRFDQITLLLDELGSSGLFVTAALARAVPAATSGPEAADSEEPAGSPLRPAERTDRAARRTLESMIRQSGNIPTVTVLVSTPKGRVKAAIATGRSIQDQWHAPSTVKYLCSDPDRPHSPEWTTVENAPGALTRAIADAMNKADTDYVAVVDAGDRLEPDACARLALFAAERGLPELIYTDEIVAQTKNPWIRNKPDFDIERERSLHYTGQWLWVRTAMLRDGLTVNGDRAGFEDFDLILRAHQENRIILRLPEALYNRTMDSMRDITTREVAAENARIALSEHLAQAGLLDRIQIYEGKLSGSFMLRNKHDLDRTASLILLCDDASESEAKDLEADRLAGFVTNLGLESLICLRQTAQAGKEPTHAIDRTLDRLIRENPLPDQIHVIRTAGEASSLKEASQYVGDGPVIIMSLAANSSDPTWLSHLYGKLSTTTGNVGMVGVRVAFDPDGPDHEPHLFGPLLLGGGEGVSVMGLGRGADDPGPGGWFLTPQQVDGVSPPCLAIRGNLLKKLRFDTDLTGAHLWLDLSQQVWKHGNTVVWDPTVRMTYPAIPSYAQTSSRDLVAANRLVRERWGCQSRHHHPMLALLGDTLSPMFNTGLCAGSPRLPGVSRQVLLSGAVEGGEFPIECLRAARMNGSVEASWATEPLAITETRRLEPDAWLRLNPITGITAPDAPMWNALFTRVPVDTVPLKEIGEQSLRCFATSPGLAEVLRKRSHNRLAAQVVEPRLSSRLWEDFKTEDNVGRHQLRVLWVDEGNPPDWVVELLQMRGIQWFVVEGGSRSYDGPIVTYAAPTDELGWFNLHRAVSPHVVIRPADDSTWMDCLPLLRGAAASAMLLADPRLHVIDGLPVTRIPSRFEEWRKAIDRLSTDVEAREAAGREARTALEQIGWIEDSTILDTLLDSKVTSTAQAV